MLAFASKAIYALTEKAYPKTINILVYLNELRWVTAMVPG